MGRNVPKAPSAASGRVGPKTPKAVAGAVDGTGNHEFPVFSFKHICRDEQEAWGWHLLDADGSEKLMSLLLDVCCSTWNEVRARTVPGKGGDHKLHHDQDVSSVDPKAQSQIARFYADWGDQLFRFRLGKTARLWGFRYMGVFYAVWWDPDHRVCATDS